MRTSYTLLIFLLISVAIWGQEIHTQSNAVSLNNEADATTGWTGGALIESQSTDVQQGSFAISVTSTGQSSGRDVSYSFNVTNGQVYSISIWAKRAPQNFSPAFANWSGFSNFFTQSITSTTWSEYQFELTANASTAVIRIYTSPTIRGDVAGDGILIDAVSITPLVSDTQPPSAITDLSAGSTTSSSTTLSWSASTDNVAVVDYEIFQDGVSIGFSGGATSFNVGGLSAETSYAFSATAIDGVGNTSALSNTVNVTTASTVDTQAPSAITDLSAGSTTSSSTTLSWSASTDNVAVVDYEIFQDGVSIGFSGGATSFNVGGLSAETSYAFSATAIDGVGNTSAISNTVNVTTASTVDTQAPSVITDLSAGSTTSSGTTLSWSASTDNVAVVDYEIFQDGVSIGFSGGATSFNVGGLSAETSYAFSATAIDGVGNTSALSNTVNVTTASTVDTQAPSAITDLSAGSTTSSGTTLSWSASTDNVAVVDYEIFQDGVSIGFSGGATSFNVGGLSAETSYAFSATAIDGVGNTSAFSNTVNVTTSSSPSGGVTDYTSENSNLPTVDWQADNLFINSNIGIGTPVNSGYRLAVAGNIVAEEVRVALQANWPDYVFENDYPLPSLEQVEQYIKSKKHLMNIPSALEIEQKGIALGEMNAMLLRKIEELTLYAILQEKQLQHLKKQNEKLEELLLRIQAIELELNND